MVLIESFLPPVNINLKTIDQGQLFPGEKVYVLERLLMDLGMSRIKGKPAATKIAAI